MERDNLPAVILLLGGAAAAWWWYRTQSGGGGISPAGAASWAGVDPNVLRTQGGGSSDNPNFYSTNSSNATSADDGLPPPIREELTPVAVDPSAAVQATLTTIPTPVIGTATSSANPAGTYLNPSAPKGIRLNNPGNIEKGSQWVGLAADQSADPRYATFSAPVYGIRAIAYLIYRTYRGRGQVTPRQIIGTWAPPRNKSGAFENNTAAYIADVVARTGIGPDTPVPMGNVPFIAALIQHENGQQPYSPALIAQGISMA